jgi:hypothetical protein
MPVLRLLVEKEEDNAGLDEAEAAEDHADLHARKLSGWSRRCKPAHAFRWEYSYEELKLAQLLGQLGVFLACER